MYKICTLLVFLLFRVFGLQSAQEIDLTFPDGFLFGTATSAYQIEGAWNISGKGESVWDYYVHKSPNPIVDNSTGDVACDFYHKYKEDIQLVNNIGFNHFRFSISWPRIFPSGYATNPNKDGILYYHKILDELEKNGIIPFLTIYHWDHPQNLEKIGGWLNESMAYIFSDYARFIYKEFGSRVKYFATINEPFVYCNEGYGGTAYAPGRNLKEAGKYMCVHNMLKAHALAYHIYDKEFRSKYNGQIGLVIPGFYHYAKSSNDTTAADIAFEFEVGETANPIFSETGDYPPIIRQLVDERSQLQGLNASKLPVFSKEWIERIKGTADYFGLNHYTSDLVESLPKSEMLNWPNDGGLLFTQDAKWPSTETAWLKVVPKGFSDMIRTIKKKYNNPPIYVLENGAPDGNGTNDNDRIKYLYSYLKEMLIAMKQDNCNVKAYTFWSLLDSFEWNHGYTNHFGMVQVDFNDKDLKRTPKKSVEWLKSVFQSRKLQAPF